MKSTTTRSMVGITIVFAIAALLFLPVLNNSNNHEDKNTNKNYSLLSAFRGLFNNKPSTQVSGEMQVPTDIDLLRDINYATRNGEKLTLDICSPKGLTKPTATIVFTHGGGFRRGTKESLLATCIDMAREGYVGASVNYRLVEETSPGVYKNTYPAQIDDVQYAVRWLRSNAEKYNIDPDHMASWGGSAGGYLAAYLGVAETRNPGLGLNDYSSKVQVVVDQSGPTDFTTIDSLQLNSKYTALQKEIIEGYFYGQAITPDLLKEASPITYVTPDDAPLIAAHSINDQLVSIEQSERIVDKLQSVGIDAKLVSYDGKGTGHGLTNASQTIQTNVRNEEVAFLSKYLTVEKPTTGTITPTPNENPNPRSGIIQKIKQLIQRLRSR